jgi:hypothetical protein
MAPFVPKTVLCARTNNCCHDKRGQPSRERRTRTIASDFRSAEIGDPLKSSDSHDDVLSGSDAPRSSWPILSIITAARGYVRLFSPDPLIPLCIPRSVEDLSRSRFSHCERLAGVAFDRASQRSRIETEAFAD